MSYNLSCDARYGEQASVEGHITFEVNPISEWETKVEDRIRISPESTVAIIFRLKSKGQIRVWA